MTIRPGLDILFGIADDGRFAGGAGRGVDPHHILQRHGEQAEGIVVAQIVLVGERQILQIGEGPDVLRFDPGRLHLPPIGLDLFVDPRHQTLQAPELDGFQPHPRQGLHFFFPE